jgi:hypothetical protein
LDAFDLVGVVDEPGERLIAAGDVTGEHPHARRYLTGAEVAGILELNQQTVRASITTNTAARQPTTPSWKARGGLPAADTIIRRCGSWRAAIELAELPVPQRAPRGPSDDGVIAALREYRDELDVALTMAAWRKQHRRPGVKLIRNRFGTWGQAIAQAGISL